MHNLGQIRIVYMYMKADFAIYNTMQATMDEF